MPQIIHRVLHERLARHPKWREFREAFGVLTGLQVELVDGWGSTQEETRPALCGRLEEDGRGRMLCVEQRRQILAACGSEGRLSRCPIGLYEVAAAIDVRGVKIGYLFCRGFRDSSILPDTDDPVCRLVKDGSGLDPEQFSRLYRRSPAANPEQMRAYGRMLVLAAESFSRLLAEHGAQREEPLPTLVSRACRHIRAHALSRAVRLTETAAACGVSAEHLSRTFHKSTGLSYNEYVTRFRLEHAVELLLHSDRSVTFIAHESGFQSISQFHRSFRSVYRTSPRAFRNRRG